MVKCSFVYMEIRTDVLWKCGLKKGGDLWQFVFFNVYVEIRTGFNTNVVLSEGDHSQVVPLYQKADG